MSRHPRYLATALFMLLVAYSAVAGAHDTWLLPSSLRVSVGQSVTLSLTSGMAFPVNNSAIVPTRVSLAVARLNGVTTPLRGAKSTNSSLRYLWRPATAGVAALGIELAPKTLTLAPAKIEEYFIEINAGSELRAAWAQIPAPKRWRESYAKHAKSFVRVGEAAADTSWRTPLGFSLELIPDQDPTSLRPGDTFRVRVLHDGQPFPNFAVGAVGPGTTAAKFSKTDANGYAVVELPRAGLWLLNGTDLRRTERKGLEWESDFTTLTIAVNAR